MSLFGYQIDSKMVLERLHSHNVKILTFSFRGNAGGIFKCLHTKSQANLISGSGESGFRNPYQLLLSTEHIHAFQGLHNNFAKISEN